MYVTLHETRDCLDSGFAAKRNSKIKNKAKECLFFSISRPFYSLH